ncbi:MAG: hypothetical protein JNM91_02700, partial [Flavobacteriales bacterium]|nr:hypothetical protein [Flavobacteriales bacterium]
MKHATPFLRVLGSMILINVAFTASAQTISAGGQHSLAVCFDGTAMACGNNGYGQFGNGTQVGSYTLTPINGLTSVQAVATGGSHSLVLDEQGIVWIMGRGDNGQVGNGITANQLVPFAAFDSAQAVA